MGEAPVFSRQKVAATLEPFVKEKEIAGFVTMVADRSGVKDVTAVGMADIKAGKPMEENTLFWIASMSKAMTAAGVMLLVDEGKVLLDDPVEKHLPEFKGQMVIAEKSDEQVVLKKPVHPITLADCLSHTAGLPFKSLIEQPTLDRIPLRTAVLSHAAAPLIHQPDSKYLYSNAGINIAGRVIEVVSGMDFETYMRERLFLPLGMKDTASFPNLEQASRLAVSYRANADKSDLEAAPISQLHYPLTDEDREPMPGGGFFSTAADVTAFCRMLLNDGLHEGKRILSAKAAAELHRKQTPDNVSEAYGLGLKLNPDGSYGHGGAQATNMLIDPVNGRVAVYLVQVAGYRTDAGKKALGAFQLVARQLP